ncbi:acylphosphatase [Actinotalea soli]|uniref:acylphosphatase n=1 Tax=Actinotalea soli TaxID=2819234 RepID=UPI0027DC2210|nr:acylphosphatase [Actinotalea soli]
MIRRRVLVRGRVQGVGYRWACEAEATRRGVAGWVRNRADGAVEAVLEGPEAEVEQVLAWTRHGPGQARVEEVVVEAAEPEGLVGFRITG